MVLYKVFYPRGAFRITLHILIDMSMEIVIYYLKILTFISKKRDDSCVS